LVKHSAAVFYVAYDLHLDNGTMDVFRNMEEKDIKNTSVERDIIDYVLICPERRKNKIGGSKNQ
jgi:hypothetical protein